MTSRDVAEDESRTRILDAAEELMAERGVFAVSLREINTAAAQKNASSVQYHFGGREGLLQAVIARHMSAVDARRNALIDALEAEGRTRDARALVRALVEPLSERLESASGRRYLLILAQLTSLAEGETVSFAGANRSLQRITQLMTKLAAGMTPLLVAERALLVGTLVLHALAEQARRVERQPRRGHEGGALYVTNLVDLLTAMVAAPASPETRKLLPRR